MNESPAPPTRGVRSLTATEFSFAEAVGGVRGLLESTLPGVVFVVVFLASGRLLPPALVAAAGVALAALLLRVVQRTAVTQAVSGLFGVGVGVAWAWWTGRAEDYFAGGLIANAAWLVALLVSLVLRWPLVGVVVALLRAEPMTWRKDPEAARLRRRYWWATWIWVAMFALKLGVQVPLYLQGTAAVGWLGTARLAMGVPLFALTLWVTWLLVGSRAAHATRQDQPPNPQR